MNMCCVGHTQQAHSVISSTQQTTQTYSSYVSHLLVDLDLIDNIYRGSLLPHIVIEIGILRKQ